MIECGNLLKGEKAVEIPYGNIPDGAVFAVDTSDEMFEFLSEYLIILDAGTRGYGHHNQGNFSLVLGILR